MTKEFEPPFFQNVQLKKPDTGLSPQSVRHFRQLSLNNFEEMIQLNKSGTASKPLSLDQFRSENAQDFSDVADPETYEEELLIKGFFPTFFDDD